MSYRTDNRHSLRFRMRRLYRRTRDSFAARLQNALAGSSQIPA